MKKITLLLSSLFFFSLGTSACSDEAPSGNTEKPELPVNPEPPVTPSETLKGSFESKFVRYAKGRMSACISRLCFGRNQNGMMT